MKKTYNKNNVENNKMGGLEWEMRPGGMLVQRRNLDNLSPKTPSNSNSNTIKIFVKFGLSTHEFHINSHATFGDLKNMLVGTKGVQNSQNLKLIFNDQERDSRSFLDVSGVKDGSKVNVIVRDFTARETRKTVESRVNSTMEIKAMKAVAEVSMEVDKLASQVTRMESVICKGGRVAEKELLTLIELFMSQLIKLDGIIADGDGDVKLKRKMQVVRIQQYLENLDKLKAQNATPMRNGRLMVSQAQQQQQQRPMLIVQQQREQRSFSKTQINLF